MEAEKLDKTEIRLAEEQIKFSYNENLLKEASQIKSERQLLKERLEKLEQTKSSVSPTVYMKVYTDYSTQLDQTTQRLMALKRDLDKEEKSLSEKKALIEKQIKLHQESKEENQLRATLGEISQEKMDDLNHVHEEEISRLDRALHLLTDAIDRHREIFAGESLKKSPPKTIENNFQEVLPPDVTSEPTPLPEKKPTLKAVPNLNTEEPPSLSQKKSQLTPHTDRIDLNKQTTDTAIEEPSVSKSQKTTPTANIPELLVFEKGNQIQKLNLNKTIVIGRSPANDIVIKEAKVSRRHAEIQIVGAKYMIIDLESSNGTFVNGKKISEYALQPGDEITIGSIKISFKVA
ncbi:MAG: FHA domain-containing protein [Deltaproteobacteria bacterium]|nr:MAG: FHA domain-containing protein [Deltaproteobacteria bacterium]